MLLTLDIGNSAVKGGLFEGSELVEVFSLPPPAEDSSSLPDEHWETALHAALRDAPIDRVGLVSVVPRRTQAVSTALDALTTARITTVHPDLSLPFTLAYDTPGTLGNDRLAAAAAGWVQYGQSDPRSVIVVDAGTAVNYEVIHRDGIYKGGAIGAGPLLLRQALRGGTAQLPSVPLTLPDSPVGQSTQTALQSGIMWSLVDSVQGMIDRLAQSLPDAPTVVLTGGWSPLLAKHLDRVNHRGPHLVLHGVRLLLKRND